MSVSVCLFVVWFGAVRCGTCTVRCGVGVDMALRGVVLCGVVWCCVVWCGVVVCVYGFPNAFSLSESLKDVKKHARFVFRAGQDAGPWISFKAGAEWGGSVLSRLPESCACVLWVLLPN